jgi:hypothetical protein
MFQLQENRLSNGPSALCAVSYDFVLCESLMRLLKAQLELTFFRIKIVKRLIGKRIKTRARLRRESGICFLSESPTSNFVYMLSNTSNLVNCHRITAIKSRRTLGSTYPRTLFYSLPLTSGSINCLRALSLPIRHPDCQGGQPQDMLTQSRVRRF